MKCKNDVLDDSAAQHAIADKELAPVPGLGLPSGVTGLASASPITTMVRHVSALGSLPLYTLYMCCADAMSRHGKYSIDEFSAIMTHVNGDGLERVTKRLEHTLKRIKDKGYYFKTFQELYDSEFAWELSHTGDCVRLYRGMVLVCEESDLDNRHICDMNWYKAIEITMWHRYPELTRSKDCQPFAPYLNEVISEIWANLYFVMTLDAINDMTNEKQKLSELRGKNRNLTNENKRLTERLARHGVSKKSEIVRKYEEETERIRAQAQKEIKATRHEAASKEKEYARELKERDDEIARLRKLIDEMDTGTDEPPTGDDHEVQPSIKLPKRNVLFVGGYDKLIIELRQLHPEWSFLNDSAQKDSIPLNPTLVIVWHKYLSHKLMERVEATVQDNVPTMYVAARNLRLLESEMSEKYEKIIGEESQS